MSLNSNNFDVVCDSFNAQTITPREYRDLIPVPAIDANKFTRGHVLVIAGSAKFPGAAYLTSAAAAKSGAGYVSVAAPKSIVPILQTLNPCVPVIAWHDENEAFSEYSNSQIREASAKADAIAIGPGMTVSKGTIALVTLLLDLDIPAVFDADSLNAIAQAKLQPKLLSRTAPTLITPHLGEFRRLFPYGNEVAQPDDASLETRMRLATDIASQATGDFAIHLKGAGGIIASSRSARPLMSKTPTQALATAGSGDVLTGIVAGLLAAGLSTKDSLALAVYIHGKAGRLAAEELGPVSVTAEDILSHIPYAFRASLRA